MFAHAEGDPYETLGMTRFGGMPDLPPDMDYPYFVRASGNKSYPYEFIGQIDCASIAHLQSYLPREGVLFFFFESQSSFERGIAEETPTHCKVIHLPSVENLATGKRFRLKEEDYECMYGGDEYEANKVVARVGNSAPSFYAWDANGYLLKDSGISIDEDEDVLDELDEIFS